MFILDSLMIAGLRWTLETVATAADTELNDDSALRERLLDAEMRRELGELSDDEFRTIEAEVLARMRVVRERREGGAAPLALSVREPLDGEGDGRFDVEATLAGDFHDAADDGGTFKRSPIAAAPKSRPARPRVSRSTTARTARPRRSPRR